MSESNYPRLVVRYKAMFVDLWLVMIFLIGISFLFESLGDVPEGVKKFIFIFVILYDPLLISIFGGTLGHLFFGIRVKQASNEEKNIIFPLALLRFGVKIFLGWLSLISVTTTPKKQAIHDGLVGSVVVYT